MRLTKISLSLEADGYWGNWIKEKGDIGLVAVLSLVSNNSPNPVPLPLNNQASGTWDYLV